MTDLITTNTNQNLDLDTQSNRLDRNPAAVYLAGLAPTGRRSMRQALNAIAGLLHPDRVADCLAFDWAAVRYQHAAAIRAQLVEHYAAATANKFLCALRGVMREAWRLGLVQAEDYQRIADVKSVTGETIPAGHALTPGELAALLANCGGDPTPAGARDCAVIAIMYAAGLRREEVIALDLASYDQITGRLVVHGKRNKDRTAYLNNGAAAALADWLTVRGAQPGPLFLAIFKSGKIQTKRMTPQAIYNLLAKRAELAGVRTFSPHDLRRTFVSDLLDAGADITTVAKMAGHASVTTTSRYDRRPEAAKQKAAGLLHVPYKGRK